MCVIPLRASRSEGSWLDGCCKTHDVISWKSEPNTHETRTMTWTTFNTTLIMIIFFECIQSINFFLKSVQIRETFYFKTISHNWSYLGSAKKNITIQTEIKIMLYIRYTYIYIYIAQIYTHTYPLVTVKSQVWYRYD